MAGTGDFKVAVKLHADASQYTAEFTKASQLAQTFADTLQSGGTQAASGLQTATTASQALGAATASSSQQASSGLTQASTAAQNLGAQLQATGTQATQASQGMDGMSKSSRETTQSQQQSRAAGDALIAMLRDQIATTGKSAEEMLRYRAAQSGVAAEAAPLILQWQNQKAAQLSAAEAARQEEAAQREAQAAKQRAAQTQEQFLSGLREQIALQGKSSTEVLQYRAAQLGVSTEAANSIRLIDEANKKGAISAGQHAQAMRMLPAQMTDVVTSVASGMPIWMVAIQQGGQIKDSFGGAGAAARAMLGAITPLAVGLAAGAAVIGLTAAAYYQGSAEADRYREAIVTTGNASGVTVDQLSQYAREIDGVVGTQARAAEGLAAFTAAGVEGGAQLRQYTQTAIEWENATGQAVATTAEQFASLQKDPLNATLKLNEGMNFLTASTFEQIKALTDQGQSAEASRVAMDALDAAMRERSKTITDNLGFIERGWIRIKGAAAETWDAMLNIGRSSSIGDQIAKVQEALDKKLAEGPGLFDRAQYGKTVERLRGEIWALQEKSNAELAGAIAQEHQNKATQAAIGWSKLREQHLSKEEKKTRDLTKARSEYESRLETLDNSDTAARLKLEKEYQAVVTNINEQHKERKAKGSGGISVTDTELANMRSQLTAAQQYHNQLLTLGSAASTLNAGERESLKIAEQLRVATDAKTIARLKEKQVVADALSVQLRTNEGLEQSYKAHQKLIDATNQDADSILERAKAQEAANSAFGKGRTAIEQMTLAELEQQMAQAQSSDRFDPEYIAGLERKIAAQKRFVDSLGQADYKAVTAHVDELLRNAQELSKTYEDELALSGLSAIEREKIVAKRTVELKYAKELAKLDKQSLTDEQKAAKRKDIEQARDIESAAVVSKAQQDHMAKASEEINRSLTDALMRGFEDGKGMAENLADTTVNLFKTMVLRPTISAVMTPVSVAISGVVQQGLNSVGLGGNAFQASGSSLGGGLTDWSTWGSSSGDWLMSQSTKLGLSGMTNMGDAAFALGNTINSVDSYLKMIPGMSGGIGSAAGYLGSIYALSQGQYGSGIGSAIGTWALPGIGTMIGGALGGLVDSLFGSGGTQEYGGTAQYSAALGAQTSTTHGAFGTGFGGVKANEQILANVSGISQSIVTALDATAKTFGQTVGYEAAAGFASDFGDEATWGGLRIALNGADIVNWDDTRTSKWAPKEFASGDEGYKQYLNAVALDVKTALLGMDLPGWASQLVSTASDLDTINAALQQIGTAKALFDSLGQSMQMFSGISGELQTQLLNAFGSVDALVGNANAFYQGFYSEQERMAQLNDQLRGTLSSLDIGIDPALGDHAKEQFRATVEAAFAAGNGELGAQLLSLTGIFVTAADYAQKASDDSVKRLNEIMGQQHALWADLAAAQGDNATAAQRRYWIETAGMTLAEQAAYDYIAAIRQQVTAAQAASQALKQLGDSRFSLENELLTAQGNLSEVARRQRERDLAELTKDLDAEQAAKVTAAYDYNVALRAQIEAQRAANDAAQAQAEAAQRAAEAARSLMDEWQSSADGIYKEVQRIRGLNGDNAAQTLSTAQAQFAIAQAQARAGDVEAAKALPELSRALLTIAESSATSLIELRRIQGQTASSLQQTGDGLVSKYGLQLPSFDVGTNYVPQDMIAQIHKGEMIVPAAFNPAALLGMLGQSSDPQIVDLLQRILDVLDDIQHETRSTAINQADVAKSMQRVLNPSRSAFRVQQVPAA